MKKNQWTTRLACGLLVVATTLGVALAAATQGSQTDPLVTLSYLNEKVVPDVLKQVDTHIKEKTAQLEQTLKEQEKTAGFATVEVEEGKTLTLSSGAQVVLRTGAAGSDGLLDTTAGEMLSGSLAANHLYISLGDDQKVSISEKAAFLVLGGYSVR